MKIFLASLDSSALFLNKLKLICAKFISEILEQIQSKTQQLKREKNEKTNEDEIAIGKEVANEKEKKFLQKKFMYCARHCGP